MSLRLRLLSSDDYAAIDPILSAAYARPTSMLDDLARYHQHQPDGWFVALLDEQPAGLGGIITYGATARIGLMAVHPGFQRQGIGRAIMDHLLDWAAVRGASTVLLDATPAGVPLYSQCGFVTDDYAQGHTSANPGALAGQPAGLVKPLLPEDLPEVIAFDAERFGASRAAILARYHDELVQRALVARDNRGNVTGYLIAQPHRLGPWLADSPETAESLLVQALPLFAANTQVVVPACNQEATALLERAGFAPGRRWHSMRRGGIPDLQRRQWLYGYANFYFG